MPRTALPLKGKDLLAAFSISTHTYTVVDGRYDVLVDVLIPRSLLRPGEWDGDDEEGMPLRKRPVVVRMHGGGLVSEIEFASCFRMNEVLRGHWTADGRILRPALVVLVRARTERDHRLAGLQAPSRGDGGRAPGRP